MTASTRKEYKRVGNMARVLPQLVGMVRRPPSFKISVFLHACCRCAPSHGMYLATLWSLEPTASDSFGWDYFSLPLFSYSSFVFWSTFFQKSGSSFAVQMYSVQTSLGSCASVQTCGAEVKGFTNTTGSSTVIW